MLNPGLFDRVIAWFAAPAHAAELAAARTDFERRTGVITSGSPDYEARIAHFLEQALCVATAPRERAPIAVFAAETELTPAERIELAGWLRSHRSLFTFIELATTRGLVQDRIGGARFHFELAGADRELRPGDCFDGRLVAVGDALWLSPGRVFHPQEAETALATLLAEALAHHMLDRSLLDPLLRMRSRFVGFESIRAEHVYRFDALDAPGLAAPWARHAKRPNP